MKLRSILRPLLVLALVGSTGWSADLTGPIKTVKALDTDGKGHAEAIEAMRIIERADAADLPMLLAAMDDANPLARNWLRGAYETIASRKGVQLPTEALTKFLHDRSHLPQARRLAYDTLKSVDPTLEARLIPTLLDDPSGELRRDAVTLTMQQAEKLATDGHPDAALAQFQAALSGAVDEDQVKKLAEILKGLKQPVNLVDHYGFLTQWKVIGPFDNKGMKGFHVVNPPETELAFEKEYDGMAGADGMVIKTKWRSLASEDEMGLFDLNTLFEKYKGATAYVATDFDSGFAQTVEFRLGTSNAWKLWITGEQLFAREEYHRGMFLDQYSVRGKLNAGKNTILLKVLQNEQEESWAQDWSIQFRVCDFSGRAIRPANPVASNP